ncbi:MAG: TlpA disulfide reductase family protein [Chloroflexi bacterium]|nr:TlpA disulfide reductase family protein [Chloroflexota bacterium]
MIEGESVRGEKRGRNLSWILFLGIGIVLVGLLLVMGFSLDRSDETPLAIGKMAPDFSIRSFDGKNYTLSALRGKVVLVNFWASWCLTCDEEGYMLQEVWSEVEGKGGTVFLGVDYVDTEKPALAFLQARGMTFPNGPDLGRTISKRFRIQGVPETYLIGRDGTLLAIQIGPFNSAEDLRQFLTLANP